MKKVCSRSCQHDARRAHDLLRRRIRQNSRSESHGSSSLCSCRLCCSILWRRAGLERVEKTGRDSCYFIHRRQEARFVYLRRLVDSTDFSHELERRCPNLFRGNGWLEVEKSLDVSAHRLGPYLRKFKHFKRTSICVAAIRQRRAKRSWPIQDRKFTRPAGPG
jgi:hypothetical protein